MYIGKLEIVKSSAPLEYEHLTLEVLLNGEPIVAVDREKGFENLEAEVFGVYHQYGTGTKVTLDDLIDALVEIKKTFAEWKAQGKD